LLTGSCKPCEACAAGKAKQKNVPKESEHKLANKDANQIFLDIATVKKLKHGPNVTKPNWQIMVDERTGMKFSDFYETKDGMIEPTCVQWNHWKDAGLAVKFVRLDNAGENKKLKECSESADLKLDIEYEFMAQDTPQQNYLAEIAFAVLANHGRALMHRANVPMKERYKLFHKAFKTATLLDGLIPIKLDGEVKARVVHWSGKLPDFAKHLRTWGEAGTVKTKTPTTAKLADRGVHCMFVRYALDHAGDVYHMCNPKTGWVHEMRNVIWLRRMYFEKPVEQEEIGIMPTLGENKMVQEG
jgi:hypothetical protein